MQRYEIVISQKTKIEIVAKDFNDVFGKVISFTDKEITAVKRIGGKYGKKNRKKHKRTTE